VAARLIRLADESGACKNPDAPVKSGDTVLLRTGWHGVLRIDKGYHAATLTIAADAGHAPQLGSVTITEGCNWTVRGLTVSPSLLPTPPATPPKNVVTLGEKGGASNSNLVVEACFIFSTLDTSAWSAKDWIGKPSSGIWLGREGRGHVARNNYVLNTRFGINLCAVGSVAEGNVVDGFSGDGIRVTRDGQTVRHNVIKNIFVSAADGDDNHDDGIQAFLFGKGKGLIKGVTVHENIVLARERDDLPFPAPMQGIGFFDGPLEAFTVSGNVVCVNTWHGLSLYDAQGCVISNNVVFSRWTNREQPWIMLGTKKKQVKANRVVDNLAKNGCHLKADAEVEAANNSAATESEYQKRRAALLARINARYGATHPTAKRPRL
jgi:parallel beta-helix repeat protein